MLRGDVSKSAQSLIRLLQNIISILYVSMFVLTPVLGYTPVVCNYWHFLKSLGATVGVTPFTQRGMSDCHVCDLISRDRLNKRLCSDNRLKHNGWIHQWCHRLLYTLKRQKSQCFCKNSKWNMLNSFCCTLVNTTDQTSAHWNNSSDSHTAECGGISSLVFKL